MNESIARDRPPLGLTLPISVVCVKDASQLIVSLPGSVVVTAIVLGIKVPDMVEETDYGYRLLPEGRAAADISAEYLRDYRATLCAYFPQPPFDRGWIRELRPQAKLGAIVFLDDTLTLATALVVAGHAKFEEGSKWHLPPSYWPTATCRANTSDNKTLRNVRRAGSVT